jgi:hypothetical protein
MNISDSDKLLACIKFFFDILYVVCKISRLTIYSNVLINSEEGSRPVIISRGTDSRPANSKMRPEIVFLKSNMQFEMRETK